MFSEDYIFIVNLMSNFMLVLGNVFLEDIGKFIDKFFVFDFVLLVFVCYFLLIDYFVIFFYYFY